ncbi:MAG: YjgP/YjgQ family permease [Caulobacteraceae bacterium]|nr:YjgP/YjgQ family permease [Caulobacteraceae bacterium]
MAAVLSSTMLAFLMERVLRSLDQLSQTSNGLGYLVGLMVNLSPHYLGLVLPAGFFIALFVVIDRLNGQSEIDAMLASGMSLSRITAPFIVLGLLLMILSLLLYGFVQPYSRYAYRAVLNAASNAGWNGEVRPKALLSPDGRLVLTADAVDPSGQRLERVFIRSLAPDGRQDVLTAPSAQIRRNRDGLGATIELRDGQQLSTGPRGAVHLLTFSHLTIRVPLAPAARLLRSRGRGEETELTFPELASLGYGKDPPALPRQALLAELYSRLARAVVLPLMPLLAVPLALTAKRAGPRAGSTIAALLLFAFQASLVFGQGLVDKGVLSAANAEGWPFAIFAAASILTFASSQRTPGESPTDRVADLVSDGLRMIASRRVVALGRV